MLIKALCDYADKLSEKEENALGDDWSEQPVSFMIMLSPDGSITDIDDIRSEKTIGSKNGKTKTVYEPKKAILPKRTQKTAICSNLIEHRPLYIFGLDLGSDGYSPYDKNQKNSKPTSDDETSKTISPSDGQILLDDAFAPETKEIKAQRSKAQKSHDAFVKANLDFFDGLDSDICTAYRNFILKWVPEAETQNVFLKNIEKNYNGSYFCFALSGHPDIRLEEDERFRKKYAEQCAMKKKEQARSEDDENAVCGILGEVLPAARIHDKIKFPGGNAVGSVLVGMKEPAFESYGKTQSYNSNISEAAMKKYTYAFNKLLADQKHRKILDEMVIVYFAIKSDDSKECDMFSAFFGDHNDSNEPDNIEKSLNAVFEYLKSGLVGDLSALDIDTDAMFYIAGLTANSSRICQKFISRNKFGDVLQNLIRHQNDMRTDDKQKRQISFRQIAKELVSPKSKDAKVPAPLMSGIMTSALNGTPYPNGLLETVVRRIKIDSDDEHSRFIKLNDTRAGIIKACLSRKHQKEEITMSLNENSSNSAYLCGRLFAVLEKIQQDASGGGLNRTIKDAYFASACSRPATIFPKLIKLSQNHMKKIEYNARYQSLIGDIMSKLGETFPQTLDLDMQGSFIIGYYQQNKDLYTSKKTENKEDN